MTQTRFYISSIGILVVTVAGLVVTYKLFIQRSSVVAPDHLPVSRIDEEGWNEYENSRFNYRFAFPGSAAISKVEEMEPVETEKSAHIALSIPGVSTLLQVLVWGEQNIVMSTTSLTEFAEMQHRWQIEDKNPYVKDKRVGTLEKIEFKGKEAYAFTLAGSFVGPMGGYVLPSGSVYKYIVVEHRGEKLILGYPLEDRLPSEVIASFEFVDE